MKKLLVVLLHSITFPLLAQTIYNDQDKWGILFPSGKRALETEYDKIERVRHAYSEKVFICRKYGKFGIYNHQDSTFTGCVYDSVYTNYQNSIFICDKNKMGFLGYDINTNRCKIIEPIFDEADIMDDDIREFDSAWRVKNILRGVNIRIDTLWGVVYFKDGNPWIDVKYHNRIVKSDDGPFFTSVDRKKGRQIIINPYTKAEFETGFLADVQYFPEWNLIFTVDDFMWSDRSMIVRACRYDTGTELWSFQSNALHIDLAVYSEQLIVVKEEFDPVTQYEDTYVYTFWNITNNSKLLTCSTAGKKHLEIANDKNKVSVYEYPHYNSSRGKLLGEIYK